MPKPNKKPSIKINQIQVNLDKALDDIIKQYIFIMKRVKELCPADFTNNQVDMIFVKSETSYNSLLIRYYKEQFTAKKKVSSEKDDVNIA